MTTAQRLALDKLDTLILKEGSHTKRSQGVCAMEAVAWVAGEPHSDHPACASPMIGTFLRTWNDNLNTDADRTRLILPLVPLVVDTKASIDVENQRAMKVYDWLVRVFTPAWLDLRPELTEHATALRALAPLVDEASARAAQPASQAASKAADAARAAAWAAAGDAAWAAARDAAWAAARAAARDAARDAAWAAARAAARDAARDAAGDAARAAARDAAGDAARAAVKPTMERLQLSAQDLVRELCAMGKDAA